MPIEPDKERNPGPDYVSESLTYREAIRRLAEDGYAEVDRDAYSESLEAHLRRLEKEPDADPEQPVRLEPAGEALRPYGGDWLREEPERAAPPEELDLPPVVNVLRVQLGEEGEGEYLDEHPFARVHRHARGGGEPAS